MKERPEMIGRILSDRYRIDARIASGSFGSVYRGVHLHMHKQVAIKILHPEVENFPELVERFEREAVAGAHISHPNVAVASDLGKFDGDSYFLIQEYVPGETLRDVMNRGAMKAERAAYIARQIAEALSAAHKHKILHRDLKPMNVMIVEGGDDMVKLIDFGFARVPVEELPHAPAGDDGPDWEKSKAGVVFGSVSYMAPDAFLGMDNVDERADLYALGVILYEMLAGKHPFDVDLPAAELFELQRNAPPPPLRERNPECDANADLEWVVMRLLAKMPEERYQDAASVAAAIDGAMRGIQGFLQRRESFRPTAGAKQSSASASAVAIETRPRIVRASNRLEDWLELVQDRTGLDRKRALWASVAASGVLLLVIVLGLRTVFSGSLSAPAPVSASAPATSAPAPAVSSVSPPATARPQKKLGPRAEFLAAADKRPAEALAAFPGMVGADKQALEDPKVQEKIASLLGTADPEEEIVKQIFDELAYRAGGTGLDILFRVLEEAPASSLAQKAGPVLYQQSRAERASPALSVTLDLRRMNCSRKLRAFDRAANEGDQRTIRELEKLHPPNCVVQKGQCCFRDEPRLEKALATLREKTSEKR
jgi:serine/threonine-protein kinase